MCDSSSSEETTENSYKREKRELQMDESAVLKWLIYGYKGWMGQKFISLIKDAGGEAIQALARADDPKGVGEELDRVKPDRVVSLIGRMYGPGNNSIGWLEQPGHVVHNVRDNLYGPLVLAYETNRRGIHLTYFGSGCFFNSTDDEGNMITYKDDDVPNFTESDYAVVKGTTDQLMKYFNKTVLNCRIRIPIAYDHSPRNFLTKITSFKKIHSATNSMTVLDDILPLIVDMATRKCTGTYNMTNPGSISHNEILQMYKEIVDENFTWENFSEEEVRVVMKGARSNCILDTTKLEQECPSVLPMHEALRKSLQKMSKQK